MDNIKVERQFINDSTISETWYGWWKIGDRIVSNKKWYFKGAGTKELWFDILLKDTSLIEESYDKRNEIKYYSETKYFNQSDTTYFGKDEVVKVLIKNKQFDNENNEVVSDVSLKYFNQRKGCILEINLDSTSEYFGDLLIMNSYKESKCYKKKLDKLLF